ncbi:MAG TPA: GNAT family N-acetyltransferase [Flavipsychrobacter sp.]|nr:GNAT family N-acetyltransferase [Flavipsychrobacter sp.]
MEILHENGEKKGRFYTSDGLAEIVYSWFMEKGIIIEHTEVDPSLGGKGVGRHLVNAVVNWARTENIKVMPLCVFAKATFDRTPEYQDVLHQH